jgi:hypothetical protein
MTIVITDALNGVSLVEELRLLGSGIEMPVYRFDFRSVRELPWNLVIRDPGDKNSSIEDFHRVVAYLSGTRP